MTNEIQYRVGKMKKPPGDMSTKERATWQKQIADNARDYLFSIGQPLVYQQKDGLIVAEYKDGRVLIL